MDPRSSRLLSGRRVPSRHSARFISRSALAIAIDALFSIVLSDRRPYRPGVPGPKPRARARTAWALGCCRDRTSVRRRPGRRRRSASRPGRSRRRRRRARRRRGARDGQLATAADLHALHALVPAGDDLAGTELELQRLAAVPAGVELLAGGEGDADVVDGDGVARPWPPARRPPRCPRSPGRPAARPRGSRSRACRCSLNLLLLRIRTGATGTVCYGSFATEDVHGEDQRGVRRWCCCALVAEPLVRRDDDQHPAADLLADQAFVPALDDLRQRADLDGRAAPGPRSCRTSCRPSTSRPCTGRRRCRSPCDLARRPRRRSLATSFFGGSRPWGS